jgi:hypothetical protein
VKGDAGCQDGGQEKNIQKKLMAEEEERQKGLLTQKGVFEPRYVKNALLALVGA